MPIPSAGLRFQRFNTLSSYHENGHRNRSHREFCDQIAQMSLLLPQTDCALNQDDGLGAFDDFSDETTVGLAHHLGLMLLRHD